MKRRFIVVIAALAVLWSASTSVAEQKKLTDLEKLGEYLYTEKKLSANQNQACATCHFKSVGFCDKDNVKDPVDFPVSNGSDSNLFGSRNAPTASYAGFSPKFHWDGELFIGGLFWDGRASGIMVTATGSLGAGPTGDPLADQAKGPFLNPVEMNMADEAAVVQVVMNSGFAKLFEQEFGPDAFANPPVAYNNIAIAIAAFERSFRLNQFSSKFDKFRQEQGGDVSKFGIEEVDGFRKYVGPPPGFKSRYFSYEEADGLALFNADSYTQAGMVVPSGGANGGMCHACHVTENHVTGSNSVLPQGQSYPPLFTDFSYDNLGIPPNPRIASLDGPQPPDPGLGGQLDILEAAYKDANNNEPPPDDLLDEQQGKFRVPTLRNIATTPPYGHNGYFATLEEIVNFYNTRDVDASWPAAEIPGTVNHDELGNLGLTPEQEAKIVLFMKTLTDSHTTP
jgi:cytochrome c peroxidase